jgi:hypothetical protein
LRASIFHHAPQPVADHNLIGRLKLVKQSHKSRRVVCVAFGAQAADVNDVWCRGGGKAARASDACEGGNSEESAPRSIYERVCAWRVIHAISLGRWISTP